MLVFNKRDALMKWSILALLFAGLSVLAACAQTAGLGSPTQEMSPGVETPAVPQRAGPAPQPAALMGKAAADITALFGQPNLMRSEFGAQVWQYASKDCVLLLYLYEDGNKAFRVTHLEARKDGRRSQDVASCLEATYLLLG